MIHFICGRPRGGKTLYTVGLIINELYSGRRVVITNCPLKLGAINEYLQRDFPGREVDLRYRVQLLDDTTETGRFYLVRPWGYRVVDVSKADEKEGKRLDYGHCVRADKSFDLKWFVHKSKVVKMADGSVEAAQLCLPVCEPDPGPDWIPCEEPATLQASALPGVFMVIDELHNFFGARDWADVGKGCLFYLSQHAKLGDTLLCVTQNEKNVDRQFRSVAQDFSYVRNYGKEKMGLFRKPAVFLRSTYMNPAGSPNNEPLEVKTVKLDVSGICQLYDTAAGVGIVGNDADKTEKAKGLNPMWILVGVAAVALTLFFGGDVIASLLHKAVDGGGRRVGGHPVSTNAVATSSVPAVPVRAPVSVPAAAVPSVATVAVAPGSLVVSVPVVGVKKDDRGWVDSTNVFYTGYISESGRTNYMLSDGGEIPGGPGVMSGRTWVVVGGIRYTNRPSRCVAGDGEGMAVNKNPFREPSRVGAF